MDTNNEALEDEVYDTLAFGNLGICVECKGAFTPSDRVVEVVRGKKPRHYDCWTKMGKPCRRAWGHRVNPEYAVHIRQAVQARTTYVYRTSDRMGEAPRPWEGNAIHVRPGKYDYGKEVEKLNDELYVVAHHFDKNMEEVPLFPALREEERQRWLAMAARMDEIWVKSEELRRRLNGTPEAR